MASRTQGFAIVLAAYIAALIGGVLAGMIAASSGASALVTAAVADVAATAVIFAASVTYRNSSFYDAYWSVVPPLLFGFWIWVGSGMDTRVLLAMIVVVLWAVRLTYNWARSWEGLSHEDWRYVDFQEKTGKAYWLVSFFGIHLFPTVMVFLGCIPLWMVSRSYEPLGWLDWLAFAIGIGAVYLEWRADQDLYEHRQQRADASTVLQSGVWARCRHPNYLGEMLFWVALGVFGFAASGSLWAFLGAVLMVAMFVGVTIPMIDKRLLANKPAYAEYRERTPSLVPKLFA